MQTVCTSIDGCHFKIVEKDIEKVFYFIFSGADFTIYQMTPYNNWSRKTNSSQNKNVYLHYNSFEFFFQICQILLNMAILVRKGEIDRQTYRFIRSNINIYMYIKSNKLHNIKKANKIH